MKRGPFIFLIGRGRGLTLEIYRVDRDINPKIDGRNLQPETLMSDFIMQCAFTLFLNRVPKTAWKMPVNGELTRWRVSAIRVMRQRASINRATSRLSGEYRAVDCFAMNWIFVPLMRRND